MKLTSSHYLLDTNVLIAAEGPLHLEKEQYCCIAPCINAIAHVKSGKSTLVLDSRFEIIKEYMHKLDSKKQPGLGSAFLKWIWKNIKNEHIIELVSITPKKDTYEEFPDSEGLKEFDPSDRKFVATANAHAKKPPVIQATDCKWWGWKEALKEAGLSVIFVDEDYIRTTYQKKMAKD